MEAYNDVINRTDRYINRQVRIFSGSNNNILLNNTKFKRFSAKSEHSDENNNVINY